MPNADILNHVLSAPTRVETLPDAAAWWRGDGATRRQWARPIEASIAGGFAADRVAWAFASAYQSALRTLRPQLPDDAPASFCVTEAGGRAPRDYLTVVRRTAAGVELDGAKSWIACGPERTVLLVVARQASAPAGPAGGRAAAPADAGGHAGAPSADASARPSLRVVEVDSRAPGVTLTPQAAPKLVPELPQAAGRFEAVSLPAAALLEGDGHEVFVKPFRTLEAVQVNAAATALLLREGRARGWSPRQLEQATSLLAALMTLAGADPLAASTEIALAGVLDGVAQLQAEADRQLESCEDGFAQRWRRDRKLLAGMAGSRTQRAERAWQRLRDASAD